MKDYRWGYDYFMEKNEQERALMEAKEQKVKEIEQKLLRKKPKMSKAEKKRAKKEKGKKFNQSNVPQPKKGKLKNAKRWN